MAFTLLGKLSLPNDRSSAAAATGRAYGNRDGLPPFDARRVSGSRILKASTRKVTNRIATNLRLATNSLGRAKRRTEDFVRRFKGRLGKAEGIVAGAHKLARVI